MSGSDGIPKSPPTGSIGVPCRDHPEMVAVRRCDRCQEPMCETCDFVFPGGLHACPACVANPSSPVSPERNRTAVLGLAIGIGTLVVFGLAVSAAMEQDGEALSGMLSILSFIGGVTGVAVSYSALDRRAGNNGLVLGSAITTSIVLGLLLLTVAIGTFSKG